MRPRVWCLATLSLALFGACSGGYPLAPTRCDAWCGATKGGACPSYYDDPAECVAACEVSGLGDARCQTQLEAVLTCYELHPHAVDEACDFVVVRSCDLPSAELVACALALAPAQGKAH